MSNLRMYILVKEDVPVGVALTSVAHTSLATYLKFQAHPQTKEWVAGSFFKVICKVNEKEFDRSKEIEDHVIITESKFDNQEVSIGFRPRKEYPKNFKFYRLYS